MTIKERSWEGLASISLRIGRQSITFYGQSISQMRASLFELSLRIVQRDFLASDTMNFGGVGLTYNQAHPVVVRGRVFESRHPENALYCNSLDAIIHDDGAVSAVVSSKRPWQMMQVAFAPGFFDGIQRYLGRIQTTEAQARDPALQE